ncbi:hypothetical protein MMC10_003362 [Thelotrema lepadinum]|nr:hypothetical protein [Thelotrema lepadinum]
MAANETSKPGVAYSESLKRTLRDLIKQKNALNKQMEDNESAIFASETSYLESTSPAGNIIRGYENYAKAAATTTNPSTSTGANTSNSTSSRRRPTFSEADRYFSRSSVSFTLANREASPSTATGAGPAGGSAQSTPGGAAAGTGANTPTTPKGGAGMKKGNKKGGNKGGETAEEDEEEGKVKRLKITYARD